MIMAERSFDIMADGMMRFLNDNYPLANKTVVGQPVFKNFIRKNGRKAGAYIRWSDTEEIPVVICMGSTKPVEPYVVMRRIAHEYRHALQVYRDGLEYKGSYDKELETDAWDFSHKAVRGILLEVVKYFGGQEDK